MECQSAVLDRIGRVERIRRFDSSAAHGRRHFGAVETLDRVGDVAGMEMVRHVHTVVVGDRHQVVNLDRWTHPGVGVTNLAIIRRQENREHGSSDPDAEIRRECVLDIGPLDLGCVRIVGTLFRNDLHYAGQLVGEAGGQLRGNPAIEINGPCAAMTCAVGHQGAHIGDKVCVDFAGMRGPQGAETAERIRWRIGIVGASVGSTHRHSDHDDANEQRVDHCETRTFTLPSTRR
jgi:hypothetical protein